METVFLALRVAVALAAVLGLIWFIQRKVSKGGGGKKGLFRGPKRAIQVVGTHRLAPKASVTVVEIDGERMVLGVTEHGISVLEHAPKPVVTTAAAVDAVVDEVARFAAPAPAVAIPAVDAPTAAVETPPIAEPAVASFAELLSRAVEDTEPIVPVVAAVPVAPVPLAPAVEASTPRRRGRVAIPSMSAPAAAAPLAEPAVPVARRTPATPTGSAPLSTPIPASVASVTRALADAVPFFERLPVLRKAS